MTEINKNDYVFPRFSGCLTGRLVLKENKGKFMMLYFDNTDSKSKLTKYVLLAWATGSDTYTVSGVDVASLPIDTVCKCGFDISKTEKGQQTKLNYVKKVYSSTISSKGGSSADLYAKQFFLMLIKRAYPRCLIANLAVRKYLDGSIYLSAWDNSINTCYEVTQKGDNWQIKRFKSGDNAEKDAVVTVDGKSYDVLTKEYK